MKILNLYAGIGGNRKHWNGEKHDITAVEIDQEIAQVYRDHFPQDKVVETDAHEYLKENYQLFDFIWSSPPCPSHSKIRKNFSGKGQGIGNQNKPIYPDLKLWQEILFLKGYHEGDWVVENVKSWYKPLITPQESNKHYFWSNLSIPTRTIVKSRQHDGSISSLQEHKGFDLSNYTFSNKSKDKVLRNCVHPKIGEVILENRSTKQQKLARVES